MRRLKYSSPSRRPTKIPRPDVYPGAVVGRLTILEPASPKAYGNARIMIPMWKCRCACGTAFIANDNSLRMGKTKSCGCIRRETAWGHMNARNVKRGCGHPRWKGGRNLTQFGYVEVWVSQDDPYFCMTRSHTGAGGYVYEHRLLIAKELGRPLRCTESVHHINGVRNDNRLENLQLMHKAYTDGISMRCRVCGSHDVEAVPLPT